MEIRHPRRILILGPPDSGALTLLKSLTGSTPPPRPLPDTTLATLDNNTQPPLEAPATTAPTTAGLTHTLSLKNVYYTAQIPIWLDELAAGPSAPALEAWATDFKTPAAAEVVRAVGAWVVVFRLPAATAALVQGLLGAVDRVLAAHSVPTEEVVRLAVGMGGGVGAEELDEVCALEGWEFVDGAAKGKNEFGEAVGMERVKEALEANEWEGGDIAEESDEGFGNFEDGVEDEGGFAVEKAQVEREFVDLKLALNEEDNGRYVEGEDERQVEELERMMRKMQAVKDMSAHLPQSEREKVAAKAVEEVMKTL